MKLENTFFYATDGVSLNGIIYKAEEASKKIVISIHGMATNCLKQRDEIIVRFNQNNICLQ